MTYRLLFMLFSFPAIIFIDVGLDRAQTTAPGGPGADAQWTTAAKQGIGTANSTKSKVWFTLAQGVMTEVYYPDVATANVQMLQFVVVDPKTKTVETEQDDAVSTIKPLGASWERNSSLIANFQIDRSFYSESSLAFSQTNVSKSGKWEINKLYITDPARSTLMMVVSFAPVDKDLQLYVDYDPSLANSGLHDTGWIDGRDLVASDGNVASALTCGRCKFREATTGFVGVNDGLTQLRKDATIRDPYERAENGNIAQVARIEPVNVGRYRSPMVFSLGFGSTVTEAVSNAHTSLESGFEKVRSAYQFGWLSYLKTLPKVDPRFQSQFNMAAMVLKAHEDKMHPGANVASLSIPWGGGGNANENHVAGYHYVWSRDLYEVATAYMAFGDNAAANRALDFLFNFQQKPDGSFPQVSLLDGKPAWGNVQMDEVAYPLILAYQLGRTDKQTYSHVKAAADFIAANGPTTPQERWEEKGGYSPSTIAAEIAGLVCAADLAKKQRDDASAAKWLAKADDWARNIGHWTATTNGKYGDGNYYIRISETGEPDAGHKIDLKNNAGTIQENDMVDAGFLELVRLGIKPADDPLIVKSLQVVDQLLEVDTPNGPAFYRYNHDGYGEMEDGRRWNWDGQYTGIGRPWPLLSGERGEYQIADCELRSAASKSATDHAKCLDGATSRLANMAGFANEGLMIPEQIWDKSGTPSNPDKQFEPDLKFGEGTGSATPLAWSMAQFIRLAMNIKAGRNLETPQVVYDRYKDGIPAAK